MGLGIAADIEGLGGGGRQPSLPGSCPQTLGAEVPISPYCDRDYTK